MISEITPVIIVKNGGQHIKKTLSSLRDFKNIVLYDNGSTDETLDIARSYGNVTIIKAPFYGFGPTKNRAASYAKTDWIFSLDVDEEISSGLLESLKQWAVHDNKNVGKVLRDNYFCGKHIKTNGWGNDWLIRLYNKTVHSFNENMVHESIFLCEDSTVIDLKGTLTHRAIDDVKQMLDKAQHYSELYADSKKAKYYPFWVIILKTLFGFLRSYILKGGVFSGWRGFAIAQGDAIGVFFKYVKVYQRRISQKK